MDNVDAIAYSFIENVHRQDLDWKDKVEAALTLLNELGSVQAVAKKLSVSESSVRNYLGYSAVPEPLKEMVEKGQISRPIATRIAKSNPNADKALAIAQLVKEAPRRKVRSAIIQTNLENPTYTPEQVAAEAPKIKFKHITIDLTNKAADALKKASEKYDLEPRMIATQALIDYLIAEGFYESST
jgi:ParB-like chromosome segregation protein Spo0J